MSCRAPEFETTSPYSGVKVLTCSKADVRALRLALPGLRDCQQRGERVGPVVLARKCDTVGELLARGSVQVR